MSSVMMTRWDGEDLVATVAERLGSGSLLVVEVHEERPAMSGTGHSPQQRRDDRNEPSIAMPRTFDTFVRVRVVLDDGVPLAGASVTLAAPDGKRKDGPIGPRGESEIADVAVDGVATVTVRPVQVPRWRFGAAASSTSEHIFDLSFDRPITAEVATGATHTIVLRRPEVERVDGDGLGFAVDSALLVPLDDHLSPVPALATALARLRLAPSLRLLIVGHASADGGAQSNDALARRRAECAQYLLVDDRDAWVHLAAEHGAPADIQRLLRYLARVHDWPTEPTRIDGKLDHHVEAAVSAFQSTYNRIFAADILVDGVIGTETLGALFDVQRHELRHQLAALDVPEEAPRWFTSSGVASAGARVLVHPGLPQSQTAAGQRRIDLLLIDDIVTWREAHGLERLYDAARFRVIPISPLAMGRSDLVVQLVDHYGRALADEPYRVVTDEEEREGTSDEQGIVVERGLHGKFVRLLCGDAVIVVDEPYLLVAKNRHARVPPRDDGDDGDEWTDAPLPATDDDDDDDDDDAIDEADLGEDD